jgi:hypothetical protein
MSDPRNNNLGLVVLNLKKGSLLGVMDCNQRESASQVAESSRSSK